MKLNLTGQIWGMPANLTGIVDQDYWISLLVVIVGGCVTYFITVTIEERKSRRVLKRQAYFELIDVITKARKVYDDNRWHPVQEDPKKQTKEDRDRMDREMMISYAFQAAKFKTYVGGSKEFNKLIDTQLKEKNPIKSGTNEEYQKFMQSLIDQMIIELTEKSIFEKIVSFFTELFVKAT